MICWVERGDEAISDRLIGPKPAQRSFSYPRIPASLASAAGIRKLINRFWNRAARAITCAAKQEPFNPSAGGEA